MTAVFWVIVGFGIMIAGFFGWVKPQREKDKKLIDLEYKGAKCDAKETVKGKTPSELASDLDARFPDDNS